MKEAYGLGYVDGHLVEWVGPHTMPKPKLIIDTNRGVYSFYRRLTYGPHLENHNDT